MLMDTEDIIRVQFMDVVVLIEGCSKTVPAQLLSTLTADILAIQVVAGPLLTDSAFTCNCRTSRARQFDTTISMDWDVIHHYWST